MLSGPSQHSLDVKSQFLGALKSAQSYTLQLVYVHRITQGDQQLMHWDFNAVNEFPELFTSLGRLKDNCIIKLISDAKPFAWAALRWGSVPLLPKVKAKLDQMERIGVISKVTSPTDQCAWMVVVLKPSGGV